MTFLFSYLKQHKVKAIMAPLLKCIEALFDLFVPLVIASLIDKGIREGGGTHVLLQHFFLLGLLALLAILLAFVAQYFSADVATSIAADMRRDVYHKIQCMEFIDLDKQNNNTLLSHFSNDIKQIETGTNLGLRLLLRSPFIVFGAVVMSFVLRPSISILFLITVILLFLVTFVIFTKTLPKTKIMKEKNDVLIKNTKNSVEGVRTIRSSGLEEEEYLSYKDANDSLYYAQSAISKISVLLNPLTLFILNMAIIFLLFFGAIRIEEGVLTAGQLIALYNYMAQILTELLKLSNLLLSLVKTIESSHRIEKVLSYQNEKTKGTILQVEGDGKKLLSLSNISFSYPQENKPTLNHISFDVLRGETIGILGATGCGKTTLLHVLAGFYPPSEGDLCCYGEKNTEIPLKDYRKKFSLVSQENSIFGGSVRTNLQMAMAASDLEMDRALHIAKAREFVYGKPSAINTPVYEDGKNFSGGQKQRLSIARGLLKEADILLLDDSFSALDYGTEHAIRQNLKVWQKDHTIIMVSQRIATLSKCDKILLLDQGNLVAMGSHEELLENSPLYKEFVASQTESHDDNDGWEV